MGDSESCKHFAYYAQLRAVMALLASEGIGVFDRKHFAINSASGTKSTLQGPINGSTHDLAQKEFEAWATSTNSSNLFGEIIRPRGIFMKDWFAQISTTPLGWIAQDWFKQWGYDLKRFELDQDARNQASYRPNALTNGSSFRNASQMKRSLDIVENIWQMCSPNGKGALLIDLYLLRCSWEKYARQVRRPLNNQGVRRIIGASGITEPDLTVLARVMMRTSHRTDPLILIEARKKGKFTDPDYHIQMLSRAVLLLRLGTGAANKMIENAHISQGDIEFWWRSLGENRGLWEATQADPISDMWIEIDAALQSMNDNASSITNHYRWRSDYAADILALSGCERIGLSQFCS
jgi:hypothetical protein